MTWSRLSVLKPGALKIYTIFVMIIKSFTVIHIVQPFSIIDISIIVNQSASSIAKIIGPGAFIKRTILMNLNSKAFSKISLLINKSKVVSFIIAYLF